MNVVVGSAFRNSEWVISSYFDRVARLQSLLGCNIRVIAAEGDSTDDTRQKIINMRSHGFTIELPDCSHGQRWFGSTEEPDRMKALSRVGNAIFESVTPDDDYLVYVESDLYWHANVIAALVENAVQRTEGFDVFSPLVMAGDAFYDIWGFRKNGQRFGPFPPYHPSLCFTSGRVTEVDSVGSCLVMRSEVARRARIRNDYCLVGWCEDARRQGYRIGVRTDISVRQA